MRVSRRDFGSLLLGCAGPPMARSLTAAKKPPNFVIILADDLGYGDLACYGHPTIRTPNLDRMAADGVRFTQGYSAAPSCSPSRAALLTGRLPVRTGVNQVFVPWSQGGLPRQETTLAEALKPAGYATACVGKWHLGHQPGMLPTRRGFDRYFGIPYSNDMSRATAGNPGFLRELDKHPETPGTPLIRDEAVIETEPDQRSITRRYTEESVRFLGECARTERQFFLYLAHTMPHHPLFASERFRGRSRRGLYGDVVEELDWSVGEIRGALRSLGLAESTLVLFTSDNGPWLVKGVEGGSAGLLRDGKGTTWEGGMRVPSLACWPGRIPAGIVSAAFVSAMDVFPTLLALAGVPLPARREFDGADISPVLFGERGDRQALLFYYAGRKLCAVRKGPWKLHVSTNDGTLTSPLLFHLDEDPSEKHDLAARNPAVVTELRDLIGRHNRSLSPGPPQM